MNTLLLDQKTWDIVTDVSGNIAVASDPYAQAQDAASAIRTFFGEVYYDTTKGVPYWQQILGKSPPVALMRAKFAAAAMTVPGVTAAVCFFLYWTERHLGGQVQITNTSGQVSAAGF